MSSNVLRGFICFLACLTAATTFAQKQGGIYPVKGTLVDSLLNESEPYATVRISSAVNPEEKVRLSVTDEKGRFNERLSEPGDYVITLSSVGKNTVKRNFTLSISKKSVDFGTIFTSEATEMLKGVEVVAQKPLVKAEIDKITYSMEDDPDSKTSTTLEMLKKVPLVTVDGEENIQVNGSSNFKVHVNGKPNTLMSNNPKEVLRSLPASSIKSIEVITEPGAKYDAEGIGGILNIITTDTKMQGYNVTLGGGQAIQDLPDMDMGPYRWASLHCQPTIRITIIPSHAHTTVPAERISHQQTINISVQTDRQKATAIISSAI